MDGMTLERAAELVNRLIVAGHNEVGDYRPNRDAAIDLFSHFERYFQLHEQDPKHGSAQYRFADMCGFACAKCVEIL